MTKGRAKLAVRLMLALCCAASAGVSARSDAQPPITTQPTQPGGTATPRPEAAASPLHPATIEDDRLPFMAEGRKEAEPPSVGGLVLRTFGALLLIVGLITAAAWGLRRFGAGRFGGTQIDAPALAVLSTVALGDKRSLAVVRFGAQTLLVGSTAQNITLLATQGTEPAETTHPEATEESRPPFRSVADLLSGESGDDFNATLAAAERHLAATTAPPAEGGLD